MVLILSLHWSFHDGLALKITMMKIQSTLDISKSKFIPQLRISQSKFSGARRFTLRYQLFEITDVKMLGEKKARYQNYHIYRAIAIRQVYVP